MRDDAFSVVRAERQEVATLLKHWALFRFLAVLRAGALPRVLVATVLGVVVLSIVGMHQLSLGHTFATPPLAGAHQDSDAQPVAAQGSDHPGSVPPMGGGPTGMQDDSPHGASSDHCPGCGGHSMAVAVCLLALTLLVLRWWLAPPLLRNLPPRTLWPSAPVRTFLGRCVPALSLVELSLRRT